MDNPEVLEKVLMYTGLGGLVVFGVFSLFRGIIQKNIFSSMNEQQSYGVMKLIIRGSLTVAIIGILAWGYTEIKKDEAYKNAALISKNIKGKIVTHNGEPIPNAKVALKTNESIFHVSDVNGEFLLEVSGTGNKSFDLIITHPLYQNITKLAEVNFASTEINVNVGELRLKPTSTVDIPNTTPARTNQENTSTIKNNEANSANDEADGQATRTENQSSKNTNITLIYNDEGTNCNLNIVINIGGMNFTPTGKTVELRDVRKGFQQYTVAGMATCPGGGTCQVSGPVNGQLEIIENGTYYLVFDPVYTCIATILGEDDYNELMDAFY